MSEEWKAQGACSGVDPDLFFVERGGSDRQAKAVCAGCPVQAECLAYALNNGEKLGVWGGLSERQRRKLRAAIGGVSFDVKCATCESVFHTPSRQRQFCDDCARRRHVEQSRQWRRKVAG